MVSISSYIITYWYYMWWFCKCCSLWRYNITSSYRM